MLRMQRDSDKIASRAIAPTVNPGFLEISSVYSTVFVG